MAVKGSYASNKHKIRHLKTSQGSCLLISFNKYGVFV